MNSKSGKKSADLNRVREVFRLEKSNGFLYWTERTANRVNVGDRAGSLKAEGYRQIRLDKQVYYEHYIVWLLTHGVWPENDIKHIDGNRANNSPSNLMEEDYGKNNSI